MKYEINQIVYFIGSRRGEIVIEAMRIDKIEINRKFNAIYYSGEYIDDPESIPHCEYEELLFSCREDAIAEIQRQLEALN